MDEILPFMFQLAQLGVEKQLGRRFSVIESYSERLRLVEKVVEEQVVLEPPADEKLTRKNDFIAKKCRKKGDKLVLENRLESALHMYNYSLCYAVSSVNKAFAFAKRAAVLFEMGYFHECTTNIEMAKPFVSRHKNLTYFLNKSQECLGKTSRSSDANFRDQQLEFTRHQQIPFLSSSVDIKMNNGRFFLYAKHHLLPGAVVIEEEITCCVLRHRNPFCSFCLKKNRCLIPCPDCAFAQYCNEECRSKAYERYHKLECKSLLYLANLSTRGHMIFKQICTMLFLCGGVQGLEEFWKNRSPQRRSWGSVKHCEYTELRPFEVVLSGSGFQASQNWRIELNKMLSAVHLREIFLKYTDFKDVFQTEDQKQMLSEIVCASLPLGSSTFVHLTFEGISVTSQFPREMNIVPLPNAAATLQNDKIVFKVIHPIKKGAAVTLGTISFDMLYEAREILERIPGIDTYLD